MAAAGLRFGSDPWLIAREQDEQATLGAGMLDRDPQQRLDELTEDDLAGHRLRSLDHRPDIQLLDGGADRRRRQRRRRFLAQPRVALVELLHFAECPPACKATARALQMDARGGRG